MIRQLIKNNGTLVIVVIALIASLFGLWLSYEPVTNNADNKNYLPEGGSFTLNSIDGKVSLDDFTNSYKIIYFGYTYCPDYCPTDLGSIAKFYSDLPVKLKEQTQVIFVSVDPNRDNTSRLAEYLAYFNSDFIGLTGKKSELDSIVSSYGASYQIADHNNSNNENYLVNHSTNIYLVDKKNKLKFLVSSRLEGMLKAKYMEMINNENQI